MAERLVENVDTVVIVLCRHVDLYCCLHAQSRQARTTCRRHCSMELNNKLPQSLNIKSTFLELFPVTMHAHIHICFHIEEGLKQICAWFGCSLPGNFVVNIV